MALSGGGDMKMLRPVNHDRKILGNHKGVAGHLNVENPQAGFSYHYVSTRRSRVRRRQMMGYEVVTGEHPEKWGDTPDANRGVGLDTTMTSADVILMRIPNEKLRPIRESKRQKTEIALKGAESDYLDKGEQLRNRLGDGVTGRHALYHRRSDHV